MILLFFGDVMGRIGRQGLAAVLPSLREEFAPDVIIANAENSAHGMGVTPDALAEMQEAGVMLFTSGNHVWKKKGRELLQDPARMLLRPQNFPAENPGSGKRILEVGTKRLLVLNYEGRVFMPDLVDDPFRALDHDLAQENIRNLDAIVVDFHAEATSEKVALGWYADGRVSAIIGTHTHVPTADATLLPKGTAYLTDVGMVGPVQSVIGMKTDIILNHFLRGQSDPFEVPESGEVVVNACLIETEGPTRAKSINLIQRKISIS
jgi:metallophosphoesterase (TIGR00282 family)